MKNNNWDNYKYPKSFSYDSLIKENKKEYLFDIYSVIHFIQNSKFWRIPTSNDLDKLFMSADPNSKSGRETIELAKNLRGTNGWINNGTNKIGFNAYPNPTRDSDGLREHDISRWWYHDKNSNNLNGFSIYSDDIVAFSGPFEENIGLAIRLVLDLTNHRLEGSIIYV